MSPTEYLAQISSRYGSPLVEPCLSFRANVASPATVIPAQAGTQGHAHRPANSTLGSRLRGNDVGVTRNERQTEA
jgi:hypothetical protein